MCCVVAHITKYIFSNEKSHDERRNINNDLIMEEMGMKKFIGLVLVVAVVAMVAAFAGAFFANAMFAKNAQMVVAEATATPSATVEPVAVEATVEPTATPIAEVISEQKEDPSQISWDDFLAKSRYVDGSFNAIYDGQEVGRIQFTDESLLAHVGEQVVVNVASTSVSVKLEGKRHVYKAASVQQPNLAVCLEHTALYRRHTSAYGDDIVITLTAEDITNIAQYAAYWYNSDGELTYGLTICDCFVGNHSYTSSKGSNSNSGGDYNQPSDEPTPAPTQEPQPTAKPTNEPLETPRPGTDNTPEAPSETADNQPSHNEPVETPHPVPDSTPEAPAEDMVAIISSEAEESESSTQEVPDPVVKAVTDASNITAHDNMPTE